MAITPVSAPAPPDCAPRATSAAKAIRLNTSDTFANAAPNMARASRPAERLPAADFFERPEERSGWDFEIDVIYVYNIAKLFEKTREL
jgi:hypothetical protein